MATAIFDTLAFAKKLESKGVPIEQAEAHAESLKEVLETTITPVIDQQQEAKNEAASLSTKMDKGFTELKAELKALDARLEATNIDIKIESVDKRIGDQITTIKVIGAIIAIFVGIHSFFPNFHF